EGSELGTGYWVLTTALPLRVCLAVAADLAGTTVDADDAIRFGLVQRQDRVGRLRHPAVNAARDVIRNGLQVTRRLQIVQRLRRFLLVHCVLEDHPVQRFQILAQALLPRLCNAVAVDG